VSALIKSFRFRPNLWPQWHVMNARKILAKVLASPGNVRFAEMQRLLDAFGFRLLRVSGSHHIYARPGLREQINLQDVRGKAKPYQIRQFLKLVERYNLRIEEK
jgi:predicted RNA binding protein YcfA (HicA-like mRNA interferase family)